MTDDRLRTLERRWKASGTVEDQIELLRERVRAGQLELGLLGLAAHLGHKGARRMLGGLAPEAAKRKGWPEGWDEEAARLVEPGYAPDRIWFPGNPWPAGHGLAELEWGGWFDVEEGCLKFTLHLESADYYADDEDDEDEDEDDDDLDDAPDWQAKIVWGNYHSCKLSSTYWGLGGFPVGTPDAPLDWERLGEHVFRVDEPPPDDRDDRAFHVYLLGHDGAAHHRILFTPRGDGKHRLEWSGRLAQEYVGDDAFRYRFFARKSAVRFDGFTLPDETGDAWKACVVDPARWRVRKGVLIRR